MAGLYIHVPFCKTRCAYCDFFTQTQLSHKDEYVQAVVSELELRKDYVNEEAIHTIYWGGGTPSLLQPEDFETVFEAVSRLYTLSPDPEITLEANPDDISAGYLSALQQLPFNRISIGVQSFRERDLRLLNRRHSARQALDAVSLCRQSGYANLSIDLMYGLPGQTVRRWEENIDQALRLQVPHLSAYSLSYEEGTELWRQLHAGTIRAVSEDASVRMFEMLTRKLEAEGYIHYEISNFCQPGCFALHNTAYWTDQKYIGVGAGAHSFDHRSRQWNVASITAYIEGMADGVPNIETEIMDERTRYNDYILTHLRTMWGIQLPVFREHFGRERTDSLLRQAKPFLQNGLMQQEKARLRISRQGLLVADGIVRGLMEN